MEKIISNIRKELEELKQSKLINDFTLDTTKKNDPKIEIITLENEKINIELGENYCYKVLSNQKLYESFESLLSQLSPSYTSTFWSNITKNLNNKKDNNNNSDNSDNDNYDDDN